MAEVSDTISVTATASDTESVAVTETKETTNVSNKTSAKETAQESNKDSMAKPEDLVANFRHATFANPEREKMPTTLMGRPKFNKSGKPAQININSHKIEAYPTRTVYQYDVSLQSGRN